jgi:hypothetical protein
MPLHQITRIRHDAPPHIDRGAIEPLSITCAA